MIEGFFKEKTNKIFKDIYWVTAAISELAYKKQQQKFKKIKK